MVSVQRASLLGNFPGLRPPTLPDSRRRTSGSEIVDSGSIEPCVASTRGGLGPRRHREGEVRVYFKALPAKRRGAHHSPSPRFEGGRGPAIIRDGSLLPYVRGAVAYGADSAQTDPGAGSATSRCTGVQALFVRAGARSCLCTSTLDRSRSVASAQCIAMVCVCGNLTKNFE